MREIANGRALLLWPPVALAAMLLLGWAVGTGSTPVDDWFHQFRRSPARRLLFFTDPRMLAIVLAVGVAVALYRRRWRLAAVMVASPLVAIVLARLLKRLFGRENDGALAYPSGHTTVAVVVMGMIVLVGGGALWAVLVAVASACSPCSGSPSPTTTSPTRSARCPAGHRLVLHRRAGPPNLTGVNPGATADHSRWLSMRP